MKYHTIFEGIKKQRERLDAVERDAINGSKNILIYQINHRTLNWSDVIAARSLVALDVDIPWVNIIANATEESDLVCIAHDAEQALEEEGGAGSKDISPT